MKADLNRNESKRRLDPESVESKLIEDVIGTAADRQRRNRGLIFSGQALIVVIGLLMSQGARLEAAELRPETVKAWSLYASATERRIEHELASNRGFLALDFLTQKAGSDERKALLAGEIPVVKMTTVDPKGEKIDVPSGMVHHSGQ